MEKKPKISIITISLNSGRTIERTIVSVKEQAYENLEYIIIDGGSTDNTLEIIKQYSNIITYWKSEPDKGISDAFNKGVKMASGEIIGIINSDDGLMPGALNMLAENYDSKVDIYVGKLESRDVENGIKYTTNPPEDYTYMTDSHISHPSTFISKRAYEKYGLYDENCKTAMDYELLLRMKKRGAKVKRIDAPLAFFTMGGITFSRYTRKKYDEHIYIIKKNGATRFDCLKYFVKRKAKNAVIACLGRERISRIRSKIMK